MATANEAQEGQRRQLPDDDTKLTIHSGRLIYAKPKDLPSFPSIGLAEKGSAAGAAAALGWATNTSPELWRPDRSAPAPASAAAVMAKDYKLVPAGEPVPSQHNAKAALLASQSAMNAGTGRPAVASAAFTSDRSVSNIAHTSTLERQKSLLAAKGAMANRQRAKSTPVPRESYPDEANAAANALSAATRAHRPARSLTVSEASEKSGSVPYTTMNRQMFTSRPPVKVEVDEQKRADVLHASAVAMAKKMYNQQQKMIDAKKTHDSAASSHDQADALSSVSDDTQPAQLTSLQDAAYKQAQARLARIYEEHTKNREYQEYHGARQLTRRFSIRGKLRKRSSSDGDIIEDRRRSQQIRQQMSLFSTKVSEVDDGKWQQDQEALLAVAQKNVHERLKGIDERIAAETGMVPPSTSTQWELNARAATQARGDLRAEHRGQIDIGAGKFMDLKDIDAIAAARVKPVLDEINEKIEEEHARQTELRLELEKKKEEEEIEKARQKEIHDINRRLKEQDRQEQKERRAEEKQEARARKEEEKAARAEQKRLAKLERHKSTADRADEIREEPEAARGTITLNTVGQPVSVPPPGFEAVAAEGADAGSLPDRQPGFPGEGQSRGGVRGWLKNRFSRGARPPDDEKTKDKTARSFIGGAALTGMERNDSATSGSIRAVALAGRPRTADRGATDERSLRNDEYGRPFSLASSSSDGEYSRDDPSTDRLGSALTPPKRVGDPSSAMSGSPARDSRFHEMV